jgi:hypothetical protein
VNLKAVAFVELSVMNVQPNLFGQATAIAATVNTSAAVAMSQLSMNRRCD